MNREWTNSISLNIAIKSIICKLTVCVVILLVAYGCASTNPVIKAAGSGDIVTIKKSQAEGRNINERDANGYTALMHAIWNKKNETAKYLIDSGADIKIKDSSYGCDALIFAIDNNQLEIANILIDKSADIESRDSSGKTPLAHAVWQVGNINAVKMLIKKGANVNAKDNESETVLDLALAIHKRKDIVAELVNAGARLFEPENGKSRLFFIGEGFFFKDGAEVTVGKRSKFLQTGTELAFIDVDPGEHTIVIPVAWYQTQPKASINAKAGQTCYFKISQYIARRVLALGVIPGFLVDRISETGPFEITPLEDSVAKEKIKALLKTTN